MIRAWQVPMACALVALCGAPGLAGSSEPPSTDVVEPAPPPPVAKIELSARAEDDSARSWIARFLAAGMSHVTRSTVPREHATKLKAAVSALGASVKGGEAILYSTRAGDPAAAPWCKVSGFDGGGLLLAQSEVTTIEVDPRKGLTGVIFGTPCEVDAWAVASAAGATEWTAHTRALGNVGDASVSTPFDPAAARLWLDVNRLRHDLDSAFENSLAERMLRTLRLSNARAVGVHARLIPADRVPTRDPSLPSLGDKPKPYAGPTLLVLDATWSGRGEAPGTAKAQALSTRHWPAAQISEPVAADAPFAAVVRLPWNTWLGLVVSMYASWCEDERREQFSTQLAAFRREHSSKVDQFFAGLEPMVVVHPLKEQDGSSMVLRADAPLRASRSAAQAMTQLGEIAGGLTGAAAVEATAERVRIDLPEGWWLRSVTVTPSHAGPAAAGGTAGRRLHADFEFGNRPLP